MHNIENGLGTEKIKTNEPESLDDLLQQMEENSERNDFSDEYLLENGHCLPAIGEYSYGVSYTPTAWVLPYLRELKKLKEKEAVREK
ncbi:hypothetical protein [Paenibacillus polymyxa]|uniref:Uncharacterized protein n=1 Tax=Paenibacillus polymyxa (strain SC2) TaxID=886882 RepID=E3EJY9_PAEPS|nr:hypothetical protein [Paenibacillus polymyxa]ADO60008.1 hypothetical protein PPSC2_28145 [Paenibacillus polymyxa SC2]WPQ59775.1 hypothetical protein SKN87_26155 [Paenibacillus polymyxa]